MQDEQIVVRLSAELAELVRTLAHLQGKSVSDLVRLALENEFAPTPQRNEKARQSEAFKSFWLSYPRKVGKGAALKVWMRLKPTSELLDTILSAVSWQRKQEQWQVAQYIPHPATWLSQQRWEDEREQTEDEKTQAFLQQRKLCGTRS